MAKTKINFVAAKVFLDIARESFEKGDHEGFVAALRMIHVALEMDIHLAPKAIGR